MEILQLTLNLLPSADICDTIHGGHDLNHNKKKVRLERGNGIRM